VRALGERERASGVAMIASLLSSGAAIECLAEELWRGANSLARAQAATGDEVSRVLSCVDLRVPSLAVCGLWPNCANEPRGGCRARRTLSGAAARALK
jgi:hypothetical protein